MCFLLYFLAALVEFSMIRGPPVQCAWCGLGPVERTPLGLWGRGPGIHRAWLLPGFFLLLTMLFLVNPRLDIGGLTTQWLSRNSAKEAQQWPRDVSPGVPSSEKRRRLGERGGRCVSKQMIVKDVNISKRRYKEQTFCVSSFSFCILGIFACHA